MAANHDKNSQKVNNKATVASRYHDVLLFEILSGDHSFIRKSFFCMFEKGRFPYIGLRCNSEIKHWVNDLSQNVSLVILEKAISGSLGEIKYPKAYIKQIVRYKSIDENNRLGKYISIDSIQKESDNEIF